MFHANHAKNLVAKPLSLHFKTEAKMYTKEFEFPAKTVFENNSMLIDFRLILFFIKLMQNYRHRKISSANIFYYCTQEYFFLDMNVLYLSKNQPRTYFY